MYSNVFTKTSRDRVTAMVVGAASIGLMLLLGMAVYKDIDLTLYMETLPGAIRDLMGIPEGADSAGLAFGAMYSFMGALTIAGLAISMGTASIAGEESNGTMGLLLGNPKSRSSVLLSKTAAMLFVVLVGSLILVASGYVVPSILDVDMSPYHIEALVLHIGVNAVFYGMISTAIGAWTGSAKAASGIAVAVMVVSYLAYGILPLIEGTETAIKLVPWYYFADGAANINGVSWGHMAVLGGLSLILAVVALVGVNRRDMRSRSVGASLMDRLREHALTQKIAERIAGGARVSRIAMKTISDHQGLLIICAVVMFYVALMMGPIYSLMDQALIQITASFPDALLAMIGGADMGTFEGFLQAEIFAITGPVTFGVLAVLIGAKAVAGEEEKNTMDLLMANPVTRSRVILEKTIALVVYTVALGVVTFLGTWATVLLSDTVLSVPKVAATTVLLTLLGLVFGAFALLLGSATGRSRIASYGSAGMILATYFLFSFMPLSENYAGWAKVSPYWYYLGSDPLVNGMAWGHAAVLAGLFVVLVGLSIPAFERRDLG